MVSVDGTEVGRTAVEVGSREPVTVGPLSLPGGLPLDRPIAGSVELERADVGRVRVDLELPDGRVARLPAVDARAGRVAVKRQPVRGARVVVGLLAAVAVLWITEVVPLFVGALVVPIVLVAGGTSGATDALAPFFHPVIALFLGGFLVADAIADAGLDRRAAMAMVRGMGRRPGTLYAGMLGLAAFMSMWVSNTGTCAVLIPVALAVTAPLSDPSYRKALILGLAWATSIGGIGSPVGTAPNAIAAAFVEQSTGSPIGFWGWFAYGLPLSVLLLPAMAAHVWWTGRIVMKEGEFERVVHAATTAPRTPWSDGELRVGAVFLFLIAGWLTEPLHGIASGIVALAGAVGLALLGRLEAAGLGRISWDALITFGGGLSLGVAMASSGASDALAVQLVGLQGVPPLVGMAVVAAVTLGLTAVASNTAAAAVLIPVAHAVAGVIGVDPVALVMVVALASSVDFALVIGTPPTMMAHSTGLFTTSEIFRRGIAVDVYGLLLLVAVVVPLWGWLGISR